MNRSKNRWQKCSIRVRIVVASRFIYELLLLVGCTGHTHKARGDFISRRSSTTTTMGGLALLLLVCMAMAVHYVIAAPSIMEVSLLLWLFFASLLLLLFVVSLSVLVCRKSVVVVCRKSAVVVRHKFGVWYCCLSLFRVVQDYEVFRSCSEGARTRALTKLTFSCPPHFISWF